MSGGATDAGRCEIRLSSPSARQLAEALALARRPVAQLEQRRRRLGRGSIAAREPRVMRRQGRASWVGKAAEEVRQRVSVEGLVGSHLEDGHALRAVPAHELTRAPVELEPRVHAAHHDGLPLAEGAPEGLLPHLGRLPGLVAHPVHLALRRRRQRGPTHRELWCGRLEGAGGGGGGGELRRLLPGCRQGQGIRRPWGAARCGGRRAAATADSATADGCGRGSHHGADVSLLGLATPAAAVGPASLVEVGPVVGIVVALLRRVDRCGVAVNVAGIPTSPHHQRWAAA
eukprot:scaffold69302_cov68-Phaeocystis_antarctica.AAC.5